MGNGVEGRGGDYIGSARGRIAHMDEKGRLFWTAGPSPWEDSRMVGSNSASIEERRDTRRRSDRPLMMPHALPAAVGEVSRDLATQSVRPTDPPHNVWGTNRRMARWSRTSCPGSKRSAHIWAFQLFNILTHVSEGHAKKMLSRGSRMSKTRVQMPDSEHPGRALDASRECCAHVWCSGALRGALSGRPGAGRSAVCSIHTTHLRSGFSFTERRKSS